MGNANPVQGLFPVVRKENIAKDVYDLTLHAPAIARAAAPGQFVHIALPGHTLRRPLSLCGIDPQAGTVRVVFAVRGGGTADLAALPLYTALDLLGPLGHGYSLLHPGQKVLLVGGGMGLPPLLPLSARHGRNAVAVCGFRDGMHVILQEDLRRNGTKTLLCTDDGSYGRRAMVDAPLKQLLSSGGGYAAVYACGPEVMMRSVAALAQEYGVPCQVSLERHMGCGIGACLVCACRIRRKGTTDYLHACKDGPVFDAEEVMW